MALNIYEFLRFKDTNVDDKTVLDALQEEKTKWNNQKINQPERANLKLEQIGMLEAEMKANPNMLSEHKKMFPELQKGKRKEEEKKLRERAKIQTCTGEIDESFLNSLQREFSIFSKDEILKILGVPIKTTKPKPRPVNRGKLIDRFLYEQIVEKLNDIGKKDLYDFLSLKHSATTTEIKARNEEIYTNLVTGSRDKEGYDSIKNLTGEVRTWLFSDEKRADYDYTINNESFQSVAKKIDQIASTSKIIRPEQYKILVEECTRKGMEPERAESLIYDYAETKNLTIVDSGLLNSTTYCRFCGSINDKKSSICKACGMPLIVTCPKCGRKSDSSEEMRCTKCGFNIGDMPKALKCLNDANILIECKNIDGAMLSYIEAEGFWPGYKELSIIHSKILSIIPPAPKTLVATPNGKTVNLRWSSIETRNTKFGYLVVRKAGSEPNSPEDGVKVTTTKDNEFSDVINEAGVSYYYAVYTLNGITPSLHGAKTQDPVMVAADLKDSDISLDVQETQIGFSFKKNNAKSIVIYRDEKKIGTISGTSFIDKDLITGKSYTYRFEALYADKNGQLHPSNGLTTLTLSPIAPPKPVELRLDDQEKTAIISWNKPVGTVVIFQSDKPFPILAGNQVSLDSIRYERVNAIGTSVSIAKNWSGIRYYLPVTSNGSIGVAGRAINIVSIDTVKNVDISLNGKKIKVEWKWDNCSAVRISRTIDGSPGPDVDIEMKTDDAGVFLINPPERCKSITISVRAIVSSSDKPLLSEPITKTICLEPAKVQFVSVKKRAFSNKYQITYKADSALPCDLLLLASERVPPMDLNNPKTIATIKANSVTVDKPNSFIVEYFRKDKNNPLFFRLIVANQKMKENVIIISELIQIK